MGKDRWSINSISIRLSFGVTLTLVCTAFAIISCMMVVSKRLILVWDI
jgi:hypothetical protein